MKKLLLSLLMSVVCFVVGAAQEKTATFGFANEDSGLTRITAQSSTALVEGDGTKEHPYLLSQLVTGQTTTAVWVAGYVVGYNTGNFFSPNPTFGTAEGAPVNRFLLAPTPDTKAIAGCLDVMSINNKATEEALNLVTNPGNIGKIVAVYCSTITPTMLNGYFTTQNITDYFIPAGGEDPKPETYTLTINANGCLYQLMGAEDLTAIESGTEFVFGITMIPAGKILKAVKLNGVALEGESTYEFTVTENSVLEVELADAYKVNILQNEGGTLKVMNGEVEVENGAYVEEGSFLTLVATPDEGYALKGYTYNGTSLTDDTVYVEEEVTVSAVFEKTEAPVEVSQTLLVPEGGSYSGSTVYSFRFDDAPLGSHVNGINNDNDLRSRNFTYSAWVNVRSTQGGVVMGNIQSSFSNACGAFLVTLKNGKLCLNGRDAKELSNFDNKTGTESEDEGTNENEWVFVSVVADQEAGTVTLYKNAKPISSFETTYGIGLLPDESCFFIGDAGTSVEISEVQLWTKVLTEAELKASYHLAFTEAPEGLAAYYKGGKLVEGSTTELMNLGTEATTTAKVISGRYNLIGGWNPQYQSQVATDIQHNEGSHEYKTVNVTVNQPEGEGNSFKVIGKNGREITDQAYLYEPLTVEPTLAEGYELVTVDVESNGTESNYTLDQMPFLAEDNLSIGLTLKAPAPSEYELKVKVTNGSALAKMGAGSITYEGDDFNWYIPAGKKLVVILTPTDENYELKSFTVNGVDALDQLEDLTYTVPEMNADYTIEAEFVKLVGHVKIINPETGTSGIYGKVVNNRMQSFTDEDEKGVIVPMGERAYLIVYLHDDYDLVSVMDDDTDITNKGQNWDIQDGVVTSKFYALGAITSDRTIVITQDKKVGIFDINADGENAIEYVDGKLNVPAGAIVEVYDMAGHKVAAAVGELNVDELVNGVYVARAAVEGKTFTLKFVKF